jgi:hypothetical protein
MGGNGMSRRTVGISRCISSFDVVASTSSFVMALAQSFELLIVANGLEEHVTHRVVSLIKTLDLMSKTHKSNCLGKSMVTNSNAGTSFQKNI